MKNYIKQITDAQIRKGKDKYGHSLEECPDEKYDLVRMPMEELVDLIQYFEKLKGALERNPEALHTKVIFGRYQIYWYDHLVYTAYSKEDADKLVRFVRNCEANLYFLKAILKG